MPGRSTRSLRLPWLSVAAAVLVLGLTAFFLVTRRAEPAYADQILERTLQDTADGVHLYKVRLTEQRTISRRTPAGPRVREHTTGSTWLAALAPGQRWIARKTGGGPWLLDGTEIGSNGKVMWMRARTGQAFELTLDPRGMEMMSLEPVLNYYQVQPFLKALFSELDLAITGRQPGPAGRQVHLAGTYAYDATRERVAMQAYKKTWRSFVLGHEGRLTVRVDESTARLTHLCLEQIAPSRRTFEIERQATPPDLHAAGFDFDPPRVPTAPQVKLLVWILQAVRTWEEKRR